MPRRCTHRWHTHTGVHMCTQYTHHTCIHVRVQSPRGHTHRAHTQPTCASEPTCTDIYTRTTGTGSCQDHCVCTGMLCVSACHKTQGLRMGNALPQAIGSWANQVDVPAFPCRWQASINQWRVVFRQEREVSCLQGRTRHYECMLPVSVPGCPPRKLTVRSSVAEVASLHGSLRRAHSAWHGPSAQMLKWKVKQGGIF